MGIPSHTNRKPGYTFLLKYCINRVDPDKMTHCGTSLGFIIICKITRSRVSRIQSVNDQTTTLISQLIG